MAANGYTQRNRVKLVRGGREYFSLLHDIVNKASQTLYLQYYILENDETGETLKELLINASARGVAVYLLVDGYASQKLSHRYVSDLRESGVKIKWFEPLFKSSKFYFGRRMHHKVVVADGIYSMVGGINISNRYNDMPGTPAWIDLALYCEGEVSYHLIELCQSMCGKTETERQEPSLAEQVLRCTQPK